MRAIDFELENWPYKFQRGVVEELMVDEIKEHGEGKTKKQTKRSSYSYDTKLQKTPQRKREEKQKERKQ